jgi:hypothetical protein
MSAEVSPSLGLSVVITPTRADLIHYARLATRRLRLIFLVVGSLMSLAAVLALSDGEAAPFLAGVLAGILGVSLLISAVVLPWQIARRLPSFVRESRTCDIDEDGIRLHGSTWANNFSWAGFREARLTKHLLLLSREPRAPGLALPRSAFSHQHEAQFMAILSDRSLLTSPTTLLGADHQPQRRR